MSAGHHPGRGSYGKQVADALNYVLSSERKTPAGYFHRSSANRQIGMYDHGFATLFLAEARGMSADRDLRERTRGAIDRAIRLIESSQNNEGGWRYEPAPREADLSVTICQIMALRAARNAGFSVSKTTIDQCVKFVRSCQNADGGYSYFANQAGSAFARSAGGLVALFSAGIYEGKEIERTLRYLAQFRPNLPLARRETPDAHWYYGQYYAAQAMWTAAHRQPSYWNDWFPALRDELLARLKGRSDGSWPDPAMGDHYATAMALIALQVPNNYLPILQK
jgi:prenyltransferase beta subunit